MAWAYDRVDRRLDAANAALVDAAHRQWDRSMAADVLQDVAVHPVPPAAPVVPSTLVLSDDARLVVPPADVDRFAALGWEVVRMPGIHHDVLLLDGPRTARVIEQAVLR